MTMTGVKPDLFYALKTRRSSEEKTKPESFKAYDAWKSTGSPQDLQKVLDELTPTIDSAITTYGGGNKALRGKAKLMALDAIKTWSPDKDTQLKSWVHTRLQGLQRAQRSLSPFKVPERMAIDNARLWQISKEFEEENGRQPDDLELADLSGLKVKRIRKARQAVRPVVAEGQFLAAAEATDDDELTFLPATQFAKGDDVWAEAVYRDLDKTGRALWDMSLGLGAYKGRNLTTSQMAQELGVSPATVSQRLGVIQSKLNEGMG
jgi:DNA-directed RNA polymerase specialized sigma subunit